MSNNKENNNNYGAFELKQNYKKFQFQGLTIAVVLHVILIIAYLFAEFYDNNNTRNNGIVICISLSDPGYPPSITKDTPYLLEKISMTYPSISRDKTVYEPQPIASKDAEILTIRSQDEMNTIRTYMDDISIEYYNLIYYHKEKSEERITEGKGCNKVKDWNVYRQSEVDKSPVPLNINSVRKLVIYPDSAVIKSIEGRVSIRALVNRDGKINCISNITGPSIFHNEVSEKVRDMKFIPAVRDGKNVNCWINIPFNFKLKN